MKHFLAVYLGSPNSPGMQKWQALDDATRQAREKEGIAAWHKWGADNGVAVVNGGGPLGKTKRVDGNGVSDVRNEMSGFNVVQAESHEEAAKLFLNHPHFSIFPGDRVEIMEVLPIPGA